MSYPSIFNMGCGKSETSLVPVWDGVKDLTSMPEQTLCDRVGGYTLLVVNHHTSSMPASDIIINDPSIPYKQALIQIGGAPHVREVEVRENVIYVYTSTDLETGTTHDAYCIPCHIYGIR